ncbi:MAG: UDP-N-acetylmuramate dehydrogenase [Leptospiraceae bacterium]|nr:UDP-N-acetylmuramate dehydrogenase [Leptospiraceae bacterium]MCK6381132.1 UDP-N-acetylmuramate dehydrogenase [Leptospiraceae bacterium]NUM40578.1 UDP-N-acetylmuramate dehydrogenase [Leptospiraceae bacterium]
MVLKFLSEIQEDLKEKSISFKTNVNLSLYSSFKIGGISPLLIEPENTEQIFDIFHILQKRETAYKILGGGTNLLISDHPDNFVVLKLAGEFKEFTLISDNQFSIGGGALTTPTFRKISQSGFTGGEFLSTIPGSVGGAVIQNAGCYGGEIFQLIDSVECIQNGRLVHLNKKDIQYSYRNSEFKENKNSIVLNIKISLKEGNISEIEESLKEKRDKRNSSQPSNKKSAGSVFKNPPKTKNNLRPLKSWELIDRVGLRGFVKGGAIISKEHCNFITNEGNARASDVDYLISLVQDSVYNKFGILLEKEIEYFGEVP